MDIANVPTSSSTRGIIASQTLDSTPDHQRLAILDTEGQFYVIAIEQKGDSTSAKCFNTGRLFVDPGLEQNKGQNKPTLSCASISAEGVITAIGM